METPTGYIIAGASSGSGKTTFTLGLMAWLRRQGYAVAPFKVGPDFIDPGHHARVTGTPSRNLDGWMLSMEYNLGSFHRHCRQADVAVVEGVMGLYDGYDGKSETGSTAQMAKWLDLPVILVINAKSMARSAAALVKGFVEFDPAVRFAGVLFNNLGSEKHLAFLREAAEHYLSVPVLGGLLRDEQIAIPERHLGLVTGEEHRLSDTDMTRLADLIETGLDTDRLLAGVRQRPADGGTQPSASASCVNAPVRIAVARDAAFCFYYPDNLDLLAEHGAEPVFFSPMTDSALPENIGGLYFGGGYPEVFAGQLSENRAMRGAVLQASHDGMPVYGECGGFMYLCDRFIDDNKADLPMTGCLPLATKMLGRLKSLGYREVTLKRDTILGTAGFTARGHEFHYSEIAGPVPEAIKRSYAVTSRGNEPENAEGYTRGNTLGSYVHLHFGSNPDFCRFFVDACRQYRKTKSKR
ncbi:MAG: cobyrinate a,c-diamide synthase [Thermodesulfobacteriota bacterium]|nr:cobyrinate a,c-diamide synthase [Thermodesulfobacteriota bacterium]